MNILRLIADNRYFIDRTTAAFLRKSYQWGAREENVLHSFYLQDISQVFAVIGLKVGSRLYFLDEATGYVLSVTRDPEEDLLDSALVCGSRANYTYYVLDHQPEEVKNVMAEYRKEHTSGNEAEDKVLLN